MIRRTIKPPAAASTVSTAAARTAALPVYRDTATGRFVIVYVVGPLRSRKQRKPVKTSAKARTSRAKNGAKIPKRTSRVAKTAGKRHVGARHKSR